MFKEDDKKERTKCVYINVAGEDPFLFSRFLQMMKEHLAEMLAGQPS